MKKLATKTLALLLALVLCTALLAGCGSAAASSATASSTAAASTGDSAASAAGYDTGLADLDEVLNNADGRLADILAAGKIQCVTEPYFAPYEFVDPDIADEQGQYVGADMELARLIAQYLGVELEIIPLEFSAVQAGISTGKYDMAVSGLAYTEERAQSMEMSEFYRTEGGDVHGLLVPADKVDAYTALADFNGLRIAYQLGSLQESLVTAQLQDIEAQPYDAVQTGVLALQNGKCDAVAVSYDNGELFANASDDIAMSTVLFEVAPNGTVVACPKGEESLMAAVNAIIAEVVSQDMYTGWWDAATARAAELGL